MATALALTAAAAGAPEEKPKEMAEIQSWGIRRGSAYRVREMREQRQEPGQLEIVNKMQYICRSANKPKPNHWQPPQWKSAKIHGELEALKNRVMSDAFIY